MGSFLADLAQRQNLLDGDIFDLLYSLSGNHTYIHIFLVTDKVFFFSDFLIFKELFVDYRNMKNHDQSDLSDLLSVSSISK